MPKGVYKREAVSLPPPPVRSMVEITWVAMTAASSTARDMLLAQGWEPFAVDQGLLYLRRVVHD